MNDRESGQGVDDIDAMPIPRNRCVSVVHILKLLSARSEGRMSVSEFADALSSLAVGAYDAKTMMLYRASTAGLAEPIRCPSLHSGGIKRSDVIVELYNLRFWDEPDATLRINGDEVDPRDILVEKRTGLEIARHLWRFAFPDDERVIDTTTLTSQEEAEAEYRRLERELTNKLINSAKEEPAFIISALCGAILKRDDAHCKLFGPWINDGTVRIYGDLARMALHKIDGKTACDPVAEYWRLTDWAMDHAPTPREPFFERYNVRSPVDLIYLMLRELEGQRFFGEAIRLVMAYVYEGVPVYRARPDGTYEELERDSPDMQAMRYLGQSDMCVNAGLSMFPSIMRPEYHFKASDFAAYAVFFHGGAPDGEEALNVLRDNYRRYIGASDYSATTTSPGAIQDEVRRLERELAAARNELVEARNAKAASPASRWPWGEYTTPALDALAEIGREHFGPGIKRDPPPAKAFTRYGLTAEESHAKVLAGIFKEQSALNKKIRATAAKSGRK